MRRLAGSLVLLLACVPPAAPGEPHRPVPGLEDDSGAPGVDAATPAPDASLPDASFPDLSRPDASQPDASRSDAGSRDAGDKPDAGPAARCGDGVCSPGETCTACARDCGSCCSAAGGLSCGGSGIVGDVHVLYRCDGTRYRAAETCAAGAACVALPAGVPDRCPLGAPPASLVTHLSPTPYVEGHCTSTTWAGWPYAAKRCTYSSGPLTTSVTVANPSPTQVAKWVVDASAFIPRLRALQQSDSAKWEAGLGAIAQHMLLQSSRIFPLEGGIIEDMGTGYVNYPFLDGITQGCSSGCYCRINSLHRTTYCAWRGANTSETQAACLARVGSSGLTTAWGRQCLQNHIDAWNRDWNEHFRAMAWKANQAVTASCPTSTSCTASQVVTAVRAAYGL
jgi:hypothetical protein